MTNTARQGKGGISVRIIHWGMIVILVVIAALLGYTSYRTSGIFSKLSRETGNYIVRQRAAHSLMEASDYLTEMVQRFALEGDTAFMDKYFEEAFLSKRREASIVAMSENNAEQSLISQLQEALSESQSLMYREYYAMRLVTEAKGIREYPEQIRTVELKEEDAFLSPEEKMDLARSMVMGSEYYASKEIIRNRLSSSLQSLDQLMDTARRDTNAEMMRELSAIRVYTIVLVVSLAALVGLTAYLSTVPLLRAAASAEKGKRLPVAGAKEFRMLAEEYNRMHEAEQARTAKTEEEPTAEKGGD